MSERPQLVVRWWALGLRGLAALGLGVVAFSWPERTFEVLVLLFGVLLLLDGLLAASGMLSLAFGVLIGLQPGLGVVARMWLLGAYASLFGILLLLLALRLYRWRAPAPLAQHAEPPAEPSSEGSGQA